MIEGREDFSFALKTRQPFRVAGHRVGQHLERDLALEIGVGGR